jgi:hypothetical protein
MKSSAELDVEMKIERMDESQCFICYLIKSSETIVQTAYEG